MSEAGCLPTTWAVKARMASSHLGYRVVLVKCGVRAGEFNSFSLWGGEKDILEEIKLVMVERMKE